MLKNLIAAPLASLVVASAVRAAAPAPLLLQVSLSPQAPAAESGRLLVFAQPWDEAVAADHGQPPTTVDTNNDFEPPGVAVTAQETSRIAPGETQWIDADHLAFPTPFSALEPGAYAVQAVLDVHHDYTYLGRAPEDAVSPVIKLEIGARVAAPALVLTPGHPDDRGPLDPPPNASTDQRAAYAAARPNIDPLDFVSPSLSAFWGRPIHMRGWVLRPPGYEPAGAARYPVVYWTHGFGGPASITGVVDPAVVAYWRAHFDIAWHLAHHWPELRPDLDGKIHVIVGSVDTYYLDGSAHRLKAVLDGLGANAQVTFIEGRTHEDVYRMGDDPNGLEKQIAQAMWAVARP